MAEAGDEFPDSRMVRNEIGWRTAPAVPLLSDGEAIGSLMGGDLAVESVHGQGSTFTVRLQAVVAQPVP